MESIEAENTFIPVKEFGLHDTIETSDNFQKFMHELFDKNGIINDLRAYLRGHIVNILKSAETGYLPACQKNFTQRLELPFQAFNILIVEYLLTMELNYTLSVFISEIPLANMVFEFTKTLLNSDTEAKISSLQFEDGDIWSILNYIGLKCSSKDALNIVEMYKSEKQPLLICILKCVTMYQKEEENISDQSSITQSSDTLGDQTQGSHTHISKCKHFMYCKACQYRAARLKEKYKRKKVTIEKKKRSSIKKVNVETFMNNVSVLEQTLIEETFQQLKSAHEAEVEMIREEQQKEIKRSMAGHALQLQKHWEIMERSFRAREEELSRAILRKKGFLWGLARSLREQHRLLTGAMGHVRRHARRLTHKESSLKTQLEEAERALKKRGEDTRSQISEELVILEGRLESMKRERALINEGRQEIENLKNVDADVGKEGDFEPQYDFLKTELSILKRYMETMKAEPKRVSERGTVTDFGTKCFMNNENIGIKMEKFETNRVINDLKKQNNVNFSQPNLDDFNDVVSERPSTVSSVGAGGGMRDDTGDVENEDVVDGTILDVDKRYMRDTHLRVGDIQDGPPGDTRGQGSDVDTLRQENERLKNFARQQSEHIQALFNEKDRLQRALADQSRPGTAPVVSNYLRGHRVIPDARAFCPRSTSSGQSRGSTLGGDVAGGPAPRWSMRRASGTTIPLHAAKEIVSNFPTEDSDIRRADKIYQQNISSITKRPDQRSVSETGKVREMCAKSLLREAKEKLRSNTVKQGSPKNSDKSSDAVLREAKRRLRKLEIEAEAVEKSYQDFRKRQSELKEERENLHHVRDNLIEKADTIDIKHRPFEKYEHKTTYERNLPLSIPKESPEAMKNDFDKYFKEYTAKLDFSQTRFSNKNSVIENVKPIPVPFTNKKEVNYLEKPLMEFRKLYLAQRTMINKVNLVKISDQKNSDTMIKKGKSPDFINKNQNKVELHDDILKTSPKPKLTVQTNNEAKDTFINTNKETKNSLNNDEITKELDNNKNNLLMVEVENGCDNVVVSEEKQDLLIVVESSVDNRDISDVKGEQISTQMTILVSPKNNGGSNEFQSPATIWSRSLSPELSQMNDLKPIFHSDNKEISSVDFQLDMSKDHLESMSEVEKNQDDYLDDFSADVDNYNSRSEYGNNSPISLPKTSDDEKFWLS